MAPAKAQVEKNAAVWMSSHRAEYLQTRRQSRIRRFLERQAGRKTCIFHDVLSASDCTTEVN